MRDGEDVDSQAYQKRLADLRAVLMNYWKGNENDAE